MNNTESLFLLEPWELIHCNHKNFERELYKEVSRKHILYRLKVKAIAQRVDCDDVLFALNNIKNEYAVVHLTWKMRTERIQNGRRHLFMGVMKIGCGNV